MLESVRARLTLWYVSLLAAVLVAFSLVVYGLLTRALHARVDEGLRAVLEVARTSLTHDAAEGQDPEDAARSTVAELSSRVERLAVFDGSGRLLSHADKEGPEDLRLSPSAVAEGDVHLYDVPEEPGDDDLHRVAVTRARIPPAGTVYLIAASQDLEPLQDELESVRAILLRVVPLALFAAGLGGWFMARKSLSPVVGMAEQARRMGAADLTGRLSVTNPRDELGHLAAAFNELLDRLGDSFARQRRFMADASHELRTPLAAIRTASSVTLQRERRDEGEYREALAMVGDQARRMSRLVEDMFTLARADSGHQPLRRARIALDEVLADAVRSATVLAEPRGVTVVAGAAEECPLDGDADLLARMIGNLLDNAVRHAPRGTSVRATLRGDADAYRIEVADDGPGIPAEAQAHVFERFFRADDARSRADGHTGGAGLGLPIARWAAEAHGGRLELVRSGPAGTVFVAILPRP
jgi:two-component system, OmpR family, sensor kinase